METQENAASAPSGEGVKIVCHAPDAQSVCVAGTFNNWQPDATPMPRAENGDWTISLSLSPGRYEYKFIVDGQWCCEPARGDSAVESPGCVANEFGTSNRTLEVT